MISSCEAYIMLLVLGACASDHGDADAPPAAPSELTAAPLSGGAHLTWKDNSTNEAHFMVMRKSGSGEYDDVSMTTFDITQYHDASVTAGTTYTYKITAMNGAGEASSNEVTFTP